ncbi:Cell wall-associated hydrolase, NlpC family [Micromonospora rhizosphaerae]|uniref:Cell wall-associated hydrolase, NlpC family n=1 Tax=Micromonospora rhizosphaerae TaxID=568872 RepID=A0A1C6SEE6_9ACTN|nr:NlpC/P60 family protein [Micromonospora rhizosphaerae]SCL27728.1 Cell wall-associated hydrolase, NlpC family [Micromonospora rhizosphaerae]
MKYRTYLRRRGVLLTIAVLALLVGASTTTYVVARPSPADQPVLTLGGAKADGGPARGAAGYTYQRSKDPDRTEIIDSSGEPVAVMTDGARTAHIYGPPRTFEEPRFTDAKIETKMWVRLAPQAWHAGAEQETWFIDWLAAARKDRSPDVLAIAFEYVDGAPVKKDNQGQQYSGDASFGPPDPADPEGRAERSDFYDYLGMGWTFLDGKIGAPDPARALALDCSGFLRMVYGHRLGYPLRGTNTPGEGLPRRAYAMAEFGPGVQLMPNTGQRARGIDRLLPGDLVFFNAQPIPTGQIDHSGIYLGLDDGGHHRFISSRSQTDGPTMGDLSGEPLLDGVGYWPDRFRTARRI